MIAEASQPTLRNTRTYMTQVMSYLHSLKFIWSQQLTYKIVYTCIDVISSEEDTTENTKHLSAP